MSSCNLSDMSRNMCIYLLFFLALLAQNFVASSVGSPGEKMPTRYQTTESSIAQHQQKHQPSQQAYGMQKPVIVQHHPSGGGVGPVQSLGSSASMAAMPSQSVYHAPSGSGGHVDNRNSYNLLSEAMSQAVSNEFSSPGSGSADGACHADELDCYSGNVQDHLGMEAIRTLHKQLDDDDNGNIDLSESDDFLREELKYDSGYEKRQKAFHFNDDMHISVKELWEAWLRSEVHNWTIEQTTDWLAQSVQLPQYVDLFKLHKVTGAALPRLAVNNMHYVSNVLGIKDPIHKQKIALKAMDVVLFGPPRETGTRWKDYILVTLLLSAIIGCWYAYQQNKNAKRHLRRMAQDMEGLQRAEQSLQEMQKELERARMEQENVATEKMDLERRLKEAPSLTSSSSDLEVQQLKKEIEMLRSELSRAEIELVDNCWAPPPQLQSWLQYTYELENKNHMKKRISAEKQLQSAREACEKLRKKRSSLVGAFVSTHGKTIDDVDRSIVEARNALGEVTNELQERLHRWKQIETCLGFNIVNNNGMPYLESILYGRNGGSTKGSRGRMTNSTDDLDDESVQGLFDNYSRNSAASGLSSGGSIVNSSSTIRDDSSCSDDGAETQSVQFYLGANPTAPIHHNVQSSSLSSPLSQSQRPVISSNLDSVNSVSAANLMPLSLATTVMANANSSMPNSPAPPLPPHSNAHTTTSTSAIATFTHNDSSIGDERHHSSSVSSERSIPVPPRTKKPTLPPTVPPPPSGPIGRTPLPPPRKSNQSTMLRSNSTDLVPMEVYTYFARSQQQHQQQQQQQQHNQFGAAKCNSPHSGYISNHNNAANSCGGGKKMVKQHSTTSQHSSSSTSSSVQSAPSSSTNTEHAKGQVCTNRWSSYERILALSEPQRQALHSNCKQPQQQLSINTNPTIGEHDGQLESKIQGNGTPSASTSVERGHQRLVKCKQPLISASLSLQSLCSRATLGGSSDNNKTTTTSQTPTASPYGHTQMDDELQHPSANPTDTTSLDGGFKKRKRKLRFPFTTKKYSNSGCSKAS